MFRGVHCRMCGFGTEEGNNRLLGLDLYRHIRIEHLTQRREEKEIESNDSNDNHNNSNSSNAAAAAGADKEGDDWPVPKIAGVYSLDPAVRIVFVGTALKN